MDYIDKLDALVCGTVSNDSWEFKALWPDLVAVVRAAKECAHYHAGSDRPGISPLIHHLAALAAKVGDP